LIGGVEMKIVVGYMAIAAVVIGLLGVIFVGYQYGVSKGIEQGEGCFGGSCALNELESIQRGE